jgi:nucleotide-binding universal stress UspA family protein
MHVALSVEVEHLPARADSVARDLVALTRPTLDATAAGRPRLLSNRGGRATHAPRGVALRPRTRPEGSSMFTTVVVPLDGSDFAARAIPVAVALAEASGAGLRFVGVARNDGELAWVHRHVHGAVGRMATSAIDVDVILDPDPTDVLLERAADGRSVLCFASHDRGRVAARLLHSVGSALMVRSRQPLVVVGAGAVPDARATDVVVALDGVGDPQPLLAAATAWARQMRAPLRLVTVYEQAPADLAEPSHFTRHHGPPIDPDQYLRAIEGGIARDGLESVSTVSIPDPVRVTDGIVRHLASQPARLLVVGGGRHDLAHIAGGEVRDLLRAAPVPLLVVNASDLLPRG